VADIAVRGTYRFGPFHLDVRERRLSRGDEVIPLRLKVFDTLLVLVENAGRLVTKQEMLDTVWPETTVEENNLNHNVSVLRKALGEKATGQQYIETVPRVGYRFAAPVDAAVPQAGTSAVSTASSSSLQFAGSSKARQEIRYCTTSDGVRLAYATTGSGPPLVKASNWLTHLDFEWGSPIWRHWYTALSRHHRLIRYDERGNGMSQRDVPDVSFDTWVRDLETVVDAAGLDRFPLLGISRGGAIAIAYAAKHPELTRDIQVTQAMIDELTRSAADKDIASLEDIRAALQKPDDRKYIERALKAEIVAAKFGFEASYPYRLEGDNQVEKALELFPQAQKLASMAADIRAHGNEGNPADAGTRAAQALPKTR